MSLWQCQIIKHISKILLNGQERLKHVGKLLNFEFGCRNFFYGNVVFVRHIILHIFEHFQDSCDASAESAEEEEEEEAREDVRINAQL